MYEKSNLDLIELIISHLSLRIFQIWTLAYFSNYFPNRHELLLSLVIWFWMAFVSILETFVPAFEFNTDKNSIFIPTKLNTNFFNLFYTFAVFLVPSMGGIVFSLSVLLIDKEFRGLICRVCAKYRAERSLRMVRGRRMLSVSARNFEIRNCTSAPCIPPSVDREVSLNSFSGAPRNFDWTKSWLQRQVCLFF